MSSLQAERYDSDIVISCMLCAVPSRLPPAPELDKVKGIKMVT